MEDESIIKELYDNAEQDKTTTSKYKVILSECIKLENEFYSAITEEQKEIFEKIMELRNNMEDQETMQFFRLGFITSTKMFNEIWKNECQ